MEKTQELKNWIAQNKLDQAVKQLLQQSQQWQEAERNKIILFSLELSTIKEGQRDQSLSWKKVNSQRIILAKRLLQFIDHRLDISGTSPPPPNQT